MSFRSLLRRLDRARPEEAVDRPFLGTPRFWTWWTVVICRMPDPEFHLTEQEQTELEEWTARALTPRPLEEDPMWLLERMEAKAAEEQAQFVVG